jgi:4-hydroxy-3-polyprenylbenzoate decarboxylase
VAAVTVPRPIAVVGITGASGAPIAIKILQLLRDLGDHDIHLIITSAGAVTLGQETDYAVGEVEALADVVHKDSQVGASIASGSAPVAAMLVVPCSIHQLSAIANGITNGLVSRAADVCLKEGRPLLLMVRETFLHQGHLESMRRASLSGAVIAPPVLGFYNRPRTLDDMVDDLARRALARVGIGRNLARPWPGIPADRRSTQQ